MKYYISACLIIKNSIDLLEPWLQYHFFIGFEHIYLIDNHSNPKLFEYASINNYIKQNKITYIYDNTPRYQIPGYNWVLKTYGHESQWIAFFDCDEFIVLKQHDTIGDFIKNYEDFASVSICWYMFGSNNHLKHQPNLFEKYTMRKLLSCQYKSIVQPKYVIKMHIHHVVQSMNGRKTVDETKTIVSGIFTQYQCNVYTQLNHYIIRSLNDFQLKHKVGGGNGGVRPLESFDDLNKNSVTYCDAILQFMKRINFKLNLPSYDHFKYIAQMEFNESPNEKVTSIVNKLILDPNLIIKIDADINIDMIPYIDIINRFYPQRLIVS
jgi:hypothetical protein